MDQTRAGLGVDCEKSTQRRILCVNRGTAIVVSLIFNSLVPPRFFFPRRITPIHFPDFITRQRVSESEES